MTRSMNARIDCPSCRCQMTMETDFERWMREEKLLDSSTGIVRFDLDVLLHRYKTVEDGKGKRDIQCVMFIEVKTNAANPTECQRDTLHMLNQVLRNRKPNIHARRNKYNADNHTPYAKVKSLLLGKKVELKMLGGHLLQFDGVGPDKTNWIRWDRKEITKDQLIRLLRFELDPDDPRITMDIRRRSEPLCLLDADIFSSK